MRNFLVTLSLVLSAIALGRGRGFSENPDSSNAALLVSSAHGLAGLDLDIDNLQAMVSHPTNGFRYTTLEKGEAVANSIFSELTHLADSVDSRGTLMFYFTGHGTKGYVLADDYKISIQEIRKAIEEGRKSWGPLPRLVFIVDACHAGSLIDPLGRSFPPTVLDNPQIVANEMANAIVEEFTKPSNRETPLYHSLFTIVSATAEETCLASPTGSAFTKALKGAWDKAVATPTKVRDFIADTQANTVGSHPVFRLVPETLADEILVR